ncbi:MAG: hypothetical protein Q8P75_00470 [bacterium]|nr:hypothetical protein [bacterium]
MKNSKFILITVAILFVIFYGFSQYIAVKKHNIDVVISKRLCYEGRLYGAERDDCVKKSEAQYIESDDILRWTAAAIIIAGIATYLYKQKEKQI